MLLCILSGLRLRLKLRRRLSLRAAGLRLLLLLLPRLRWPLLLPLTGLRLWSGLLLRLLLLRRPPLLPSGLRCSLRRSRDRRTGVVCGVRVGGVVLRCAEAGAARLRSGVLGCCCWDCCCGCGCGGGTAGVIV